MCRIVLYVLGQPIRQRTSTDPAYEKGDVVMVVEDGVWLGKDIERGSPAEQAGTWWKIIELPGVSAADFSTLTQKGVGRKRARFVDETAISGQPNKTKVLAAIRNRS